MRELIDAVAVYRLTRLVTADVIAAPMRDRAIAAAYAYRDRDEPSWDKHPGPEGAETWTDVAIGDPRAPKLATLLVCRWCASVWIAAAVVVLRRRAPRAWAQVADAAAMSAAAALLARFEDD